MESLKNHPLPDELAMDNLQALVGAVKKKCSHAENPALVRAENGPRADSYFFYFRGDDGQRYNVAATAQPDGSLSDIRVAEGVNEMTDEV